MSFFVFLKGNLYNIISISTWLDEHKKLKKKLRLTFWSATYIGESQYGKLFILANFKKLKTWNFWILNHSNFKKKET